MASSPAIPPNPAPEPGGGLVIPEPSVSCTLAIVLGEPLETGHPAPFDRLEPGTVGVVTKVDEERGFVVAMFGNETFAVNFDAVTMFVQVPLQYAVNTQGEEPSLNAEKEAGDTPPDDLTTNDIVGPMDAREAAYVLAWVWRSLGNCPMRVPQTVLIDEVRLTGTYDLYSEEIVIEREPKAHGLTDATVTRDRTARDLGDIERKLSGAKAARVQAEMDRDNHVRQSLVDGTEPVPEADYLAEIAQIDADIDRLSELRREAQEAHDHAAQRMREHQRQYLRFPIKNVGEVFLCRSST